MKLFPIVQKLRNEGGTSYHDIACSQRLYLTRIVKQGGTQYFLLVAFGNTMYSILLTSSLAIIWSLVIESVVFSSLFWIMNNNSLSLVTTDDWFFCLFALCSADFLWFPTSLSLSVDRWLSAARPSYPHVVCASIWAVYPLFWQSR
jgi:hypothetical protein